MILYYRLMTKWSGLGDITELSRVGLSQYRTMKYFLERANAAHAAMQDPQKVYSTWMTEYLNKKQKAALCHRAYPEPLRREPGDEVQWKYQISCQSKSQKVNGEITIQKTVIGNHTCSCS
jgi:hypothetical protein